MANMRKELFVWRRGTAGATVAANATTVADAPIWVPAPAGATKVRVRLRTPLGGGRVDVYQGPRANGTLAVTDNLNLGGAGADRGVYDVVDEVLGFQYVNGSAVQRPEITVSIA